MSEYEDLNCPGCGRTIAFHVKMPGWFEQLCPFCMRKFKVERWRVTAGRMAKQAAEAEKAEGKKPEAGTDIAG